MRHLPNIITAFRILLVLPTAWMLWESRMLEAFVLMIVAGVSDAVDGYLARRFNWISRLGAVLDPLADKFLVAAIFVVFTIQGHIPLWVAIIVLVRDFTILGGAGVYKLLYEKVEIAPSRISKANTLMQIITLSLLIASLLPIGPLAEPADAFVQVLFYVLAILGIVSGIDYVVRWSNKAFHEGRRRRSYKGLGRRAGSAE